MGIGGTLLPLGGAALGGVLAGALAGGGWRLGLLAGLAAALPAAPGLAESLLDMLSGGYLLDAGFVVTLFAAYLTLGGSIGAYLAGWWQANRGSQHRFSSPRYFLGPRASSGLLALALLFVSYVVVTLVLPGVPLPHVLLLCGASAAASTSVIRHGRPTGLRQTGWAFLVAALALAAFTLGVAGTAVVSLANPQ